MQLNYPEFAFSTTTQVILFFVNCLVTTLSYYWGANTILKIYQKRVSIKNRLIFSFISAMAFNILVIYLISFLNGIFTKDSMGFLDAGSGVIRIFITIVNPFSYIVLYFLGIRILGLSSYKSINIMKLSYVYYLTCSVVIRFAGRILLPDIRDVNRWNYLHDMLAIILGTVFIYILYRVLDYIISRRGIILNIPDNTVVQNVKFELFKNIISCSLIYLFVVFCLYYMEMDFIHYILVFSMLLIYISLSIATECSKVYNEKLANKEEHISVLSKSIDEFRSVKNDFSNILETYSDYLEIKDYENLEKYHRKMMKSTVATGVRLDISKRISENPSFFSLLISKLELAEEKDINFELMLTCDMQDVYIDELDFCRIMAILLDNAIEEAELTETKQINFSTQMQQDGSKLFILSNDTLNNVDVKEIFVSGFTTKKGHMGQGLAQVRKILDKYGNSILNIDCYKGIFTVYLSLKY